MARPNSAARTSIAASTAKAKGAPPSSTGSMPRRRWCITGLPTKTSSTISSLFRPACFAATSISVCKPAITALVISAAPPGFMMPYDTRLIKSSPNLICGFIAPVEASTLPVTISHKCADMVVDPTSMATPAIWSFRPGQMATILCPSRSATVTCHLP